MGDLTFLLGAQRLSFPLVASADAQPPHGLLLDGALAFGQLDYRRDVRLPEEMPRFSLVLAGGASDAQASAYVSFLKFLRSGAEGKSQPKYGYLKVPVAGERGKVRLFATPPARGEPLSAATALVCRHELGFAPPSAAKAAVPAAGAAEAATATRKRPRESEGGERGGGALAGGGGASARARPTPVVEKWRPISTSRVRAMEAADPLVGFPATKPPVAENRHGWFFISHKIILAALLDGRTDCVLELGSWLGKSTTFIAESAPNATIFAIDLWSNEFVLNDDHYTDSSNERGDATFSGQGRGSQLQENREILLGDSIHDVFCVNMWEHRYRALEAKAGGAAAGGAAAGASASAGGAGAGAGARHAGIVPLRMTTLQGMEVLRAAGVQPQVVYIDADHHYLPAKMDIEFCLKHFPQAQILGDDWDYPDVQRAAKELAVQYGKTIIAEGNKCWTYAELTPAQLSRARARFAEGSCPPSDALDAVFQNLLDVLSGADSREEMARALERSAGKMPLDYLGVANGRKKARRTLLMNAALLGRPRVLELLLERGAAVNFFNKAKPETALHLAAYALSEECAIALLKAGADKTIRNDWSETADVTAKSKGGDKIAATILSFGA